METLDSGVRMESRRSRGELESQLLRRLWDSPTGLTAREIVRSFGGKENVPSMSTVLTVLDRLAKKGSVRRTAGPEGYVFEAALPESAYRAQAMSAALLASADRAGVLTHFAGTLESGEVDLLRQILARSRDAREEA